MGKEDKRGAFERLGKARMNKIIDTIRLLGNLHRKSNYSYDKKDVEKMKKTINKELTQIWTLFETGAETPENESFEF